MIRLDAGQRFGGLVLLTPVARRIDRRLAGLFRCDCGSERELPFCRVKAGNYTHCGCKTDYRTHSIKHGMHGTREYASWLQMKYRCLDPNNKDYPHYGAKGVTIHAAWVNSFEAFYAHVGRRPPGTSLDRIHTLGNYEPGNVRWASARVQCANRRKAWDVQIGSLFFDSMAEAARHFGVSETSVVRWCEGFFDRRRGHRTLRRPDCKRTRRYAE